MSLTFHSGGTAVQASHPNKSNDKKVESWLAATSDPVGDRSTSPPQAEIAFGKCKLTFSTDI